MTHPRLIAFYLPQYHPIPENDLWWGKGFTEWANVVKARPLFPWHDQPQLPADLGFYDLRVPEVRQAQADLAKEHGIYGFCYYHYWFNGHHLLERPFNEVLASGQPDFPFCLCWANENWTKAWDGLEQDVLIQQDYNPEDDRQHIRWLAKAFRDKRYIRVDGKPLFLVYRVSNLPNPRQTISIWREEASKMGIGGIYICTVESLRGDRIDPHLIGFDAAVEFQPDWLNLGHPLYITKENNQVLEYAALVERMLQKPAAPYKRFPCITPSWDNTSRRRKDAFIFKDSSPQLYQHWLEESIRKFEPYGLDEDFIFVNAWNEWGEGAYLEPSQKWGHAYLEATRNALPNSVERNRSRPITLIQSPTTSSDERPLVSVCIPTYNGGKYLASAMQSVLSQTLNDFELIIVDDCSTDKTELVVRSFNNASIRYIQNPQRLGLVGNWNRCIELAQGKYVCIFHQDDVMLPDNLKEKIAILEANPNVGMVHSNVQQIGEQDELISEWWYFQPDPCEPIIQTGSDYFKKLLMGVNIVCCPSVIARRICYEHLGKFDTRLPFTADWEMWLRIVAQHDVAYLPEALIKYRRHADNETLKYTGVKELEHAYRAKMIALTQNAGFIPAIGTLKVGVQQAYEQQALERAAEHYRIQEYAMAKDYLSFAAFVHASETNGALIDVDVDWFVNLIDRAWRDKPPARTNTAFPSHQTVQAGIPVEESLRQQPLYVQIAQGMWARDIAAYVPTTRLVKAMILKLSTRPGFRWTRRLREPVKKLLKW